MVRVVGMLPIGIPQCALKITSSSANIIRIKNYQVSVKSGAFQSHKLLKKSEEQVETQVYQTLIHKR